MEGIIYNMQGKYMWITNDVNLLKEIVVITYIEEKKTHTRKLCTRFPGPASASIELK